MMKLRLSLKRLAAPNLTASSNRLADLEDDRGSDEFFPVEYKLTSLAETNKK